MSRVIRREREQQALNQYLNDLKPSPLVFIYGARGSGKTLLVKRKFAELKHNTAFVDC